MSENPIHTKITIIGIILLIGAYIANTYYIEYHLPLVGTIRKYPYRDYAFPLGIIGAALLIAGLATSFTTHKQTEF